jgi:putative hydrolase of the HAD superfamily
MIRAILFDADGVIQTADETFIPQLKSLIAETEHADRFLAEVFAAEKPCMAGKKDFAEELERVLETWDVHIPIQQALAIWQLIHPVPGILHKISTIRQTGVPCYLATNQELHRANYMRVGLNYDSLFDGAFYSCDIGAVKPDESYFHKVLSLLAIPAKELLFIDDKDMNVEAAQACGLNAFQFDVQSMSADSMTCALKRFGIN